MPFKIVRNDITKVKADVIVNLKVKIKHPRCILFVNSEIPAC